jgi:Holliday junction resolvasome RuvABC ATP-dependent DNA helicase subunit
MLKQKLFLVITILIPAHSIQGAFLSRYVSELGLSDSCSKAFSAEIGLPFTEAKVSAPAFFAGVAASGYVGYKFFHRDSKYKEYPYSTFTDEDIDALTESYADTLMKTAGKFFHGINSLQMIFNIAVIYSSFSALESDLQIKVPRQFLLGITGYFAVATLLKNFLQERSQINELSESWKDLHNKIQQKEPGFKPKRAFEYVGELPQDILSYINMKTKNPELYAIRNISSPHGFILFGPPGIGKTLMIKRLVKEMDASLLERASKDIINKFYGDSAKNMGELINQAYEKRITEGKKLCILFIDEFEGLAGSRENNSGNLLQEETRTVDTLLTEIEKASSKGVLFIGATNHINMIDSAVKRAGRLKPIEMQAPNESQRTELIKHYYQHYFNQPVQESLLNEFKSEYSNSTQAEIAEGMRKKAMEEVEEFFIIK